VGNCRFCEADLDYQMLDLGMSPLCQSRILPDQLIHVEPFYPLRVFYCTQCSLVQLQEYVAPSEIFSDYAYFSSYSASWLQHATDYTSTIIARLALDSDSFVVELASNDGYLLRNFVEKSIPCLGIEPAENVARVAVENGVPTLSRFFGTGVAEYVRSQHGSADLIIGNNVLAHVPDLNGFVGGMKILLSESAVITMEFPHLEKLIGGNQFDTIYHEHFSYFSFLVVEKVFGRHALRIFDVDELETHGGSLRIYVCHEGEARATTENVDRLRQREIDKGFDNRKLYEGFAEKVKATKRGILSFLIEQKNNGKSIAGYGAPGKGNTLLNYCGIREDFLDYTVDMSPHKQNTYTPGTRIPVFSPDKIKETRPDFVFILPWNLQQEITSQHAYIHEWGGQFVVPIPELTIL
jgi:hypothetical protein